MKKALFISTIIACFALEANAEKQVEKTFGNWYVLSDTKKDSKTCYMVSLPIKKQDNLEKRKDAHLIITKFDDRVQAEVSSTSGFKYQIGSSAEIKIDEKKQYKLANIIADTAWTKSETDDRTLIAAMKAGNSFEIKSTNEKGGYALDIYSLKGFTKAYAEIISLCKKDIAKPVSLGKKK